MTTPSTPDKTPEWMLLLEKKKNRPHRLAHEIGAGAPCLSCGDKCPGLDLHFWRKVCRNCKCKKEEHDVKDDDGYAQFEILLGVGDKRKKPGAVLKIKVPDVVDNSIATSKNGVPFDWVPPNVSDDVAAEYMQQLPAAKLPISGSDGALYRRQQLERQMPLHDLDAGRCHNLTPEEIEELKKYLDNLKSNVVGQGRVTKVPTLYTEQRLAYHGLTLERNTSSTLHSSYSDQSLRTLPPLPRNAYNAIPRPFQGPQSNMMGDDDLPPPLPDSLPPDFDNNNLKTPSSFVPKKNDASLMSSSCLNNVAHSDAVGGQYYTKLTEQYREGSGPNRNEAGNDTSLLSSIQSNNVAYSNAVHGQFYPGTLTGPSGGRNGPNNGDQQMPSTYSNNDAARGQAYTDRLTGSYGGMSGPNKNMSGSDASLTSSTYSNNIAQSNAVPGQYFPGSITGSQGPLEYHRENYLYPSAQEDQNLPGFPQNDGDLPQPPNFLQDGSIVYSQDPYNVAGSTGVGGNLASKISYSKNLHGNATVQPEDSSQNTYNVANSQNDPYNYNPESQNIHGSSADARQYGSTGPPQYPSELAASTNYPGQLPPGLSGPHQQNTGSQLPASTGSFSNQDKLSYPDVHRNVGDSQFVNENWSKNSQLPGDMRFEHSLLPYNVAESSDIKGNSMPLSAQVIQQSSLIDNDLASQMELLSAEKHPVGSHLNCKHCTEPLVAGNVAVFADRAGDSTAWHPNCFVCNTCDELLVDLIYFFSKGNVYCGRHFAELLNIPRCYACDELIFVKEYTVAEGKTFHVKHFCCYECDDPLAGKQYVPTDDQPTCLDCYQEIFGKRCHTCRKKIPAGHQRVGWKELNWHAQDKCFRCHYCSKSLLGGKFVMKEEQPFCDRECTLASGI